MKLYKIKKGTEIDFGNGNKRIFEGMDGMYGKWRQ
jgi:hypothetical protein